MLIVKRPVGGKTENLLRPQRVKLTVSVNQNSTYQIESH